MAKYKLLQARIPSDIHHKLQAEARASGATAATWLRQMLIRHFRDKRVEE